MYTKLRKILAITLSILVVILGISFIVSTLHLYITGGDSPYSRERVGMYLRYMLIPTIPCLAVMIASFIIEHKYANPSDGNIAGSRSTATSLKTMSERFKLDECDDSVRDSIRTERFTRRVWYTVATVLSVILGAASLTHALIYDYTIKNLNFDVISVLSLALPLSLIALGVWIMSVFECDKSRMRELDDIKNAVRENPALLISPAEKKDTSLRKERAVLIIRCAVLAVSVLFVVLGVINGTMADVIGKAVKICTECIGLG